MYLEHALPLAEKYVTLLAPHCERIEIAGSIRRKKFDVKDIEIVAIPKPYETGLFASGIATVVNQWEKVKGDLPCKYTQRILPEGIKLDLFFATPTNWGLILVYRTGSSEFNIAWLRSMKLRGYRMLEGTMFYKGKEVFVREEKDLFNRMGERFILPEHREANNNVLLEQRPIINV